MLWFKHLYCIRYQKSYLIWEANSQSLLLRHPAQRKHRQIKAIKVTWQYNPAAKYQMSSETVCTNNSPCTRSPDPYPMRAWLQPCLVQSTRTVHHQVGTGGISARYSCRRITKRGVSLCAMHGEHCDRQPWHHTTVQIRLHICKNCCRVGTVTQWHCSYPVAHTCMHSNSMQCQQKEHCSASTHTYTATALQPVQEINPQSSLTQRDLKD